MKYREIKTIGVVGTGLIGTSWAAFFLACGFRVVATDPAPGAQARLRDFIGKAWPALNRLGVTEESTPLEPIFADTLEDCVSQADFIQESGPERADTKRDTYVKMDALAAPDVILASSTSGFRPSQLQQDCRQDYCLLYWVKRHTSKHLTVFQRVVTATRWVDNDSLAVITSRSTCS